MSAVFGVTAARLLQATIQSGTALLLHKQRTLLVCSRNSVHFCFFSELLLPDSCARFSDTIHGD